jgi:hypothetical protein
MTQNGHLPAFDLSRLSYGDLRRMQQIDTSTPEGQEVLDVILARCVVGGLDAIPITAMLAIVPALMQAITEAVSPKDQPAAPSLTASDAAGSAVTTT